MYYPQRALCRKRYLTKSQLVTSCSLIRYISDNDMGTITITHGGIITLMTMTQTGTNTVHMLAEELPRIIRGLDKA